MGVTNFEMKVPGLKHQKRTDNIFAAYNKHSVTLNLPKLFHPTSTNPRISFWSRYINS